MTNCKAGLERSLLINRVSDNVTNTKWVDSDGFMVGIKKAGEKVLAVDYIKVMESKGLSVMYSDNYRKSGVN